MQRVALALLLVLVSLPISAQDADGDGILDQADNCPGVANCGTGLEELQELTLDGTTGIEFGHDVAISGDGTTLLVSRLRDDLSFGHGGVYAYERVGDAWVERQRLTVSLPLSFQNFFGYSIAPSAGGSRAAVGSPNEAPQPGDTVQGSAYVFERVAGVWSQVARLKPQAACSLSPIGFGGSVALSGDGETLAVGQGTAGGAGIYVFERDGVVWEQTGCFAQTSNSLGFPAAISGDGSTVVVGAQFEDSGGVGNSGAALVYREQAGLWQLLDQVEADDPTAGALFGSRIAVDGDGSTILVGTPYHVEGGTLRTGVAYVFEESGGAWSQQAKLLPSGSTPCDDTRCFGGAVELDADGDRAWIGAVDDSEAGLGAGTVYVWSRSTGSWLEETRLFAANADDFDRFGHAVDLSADGGTLAVGALATDRPNQSGSAYLFGPACQLDRDFDGAGDACDCADDDPETFPGAPEVCDTLDNDCDLEIDEDQDADADLVPDCSDLCPGIPYFAQLDGDLDGIGDACDNCVARPTRSRRDTDTDGTGDACDPDRDADTVADDDGDGVINRCTAGSTSACDDNCPLVTNLDQADGDGDGVGDGCDLCVSIPNRRQRDRDRDGQGNACDADLDGDGIPDSGDADRDGDGVPEDDGDGTADPCPSGVFLSCDDNCPIDENPLQLDVDGNGLGDACDGQDRRAARVASRRRAASGARGPDAGGAALLAWIPEEGAETYNVYSGELSALAVGDYGRCYRSGLTAPEVVLTDTPAVGTGRFYLISVVDAAGEAGFGVDSDGVERVLDRPCP